MEQKFSEEIILSDLDVDNQVVATPCLDSCQNSNVWPYCQNVLFKSFPMEEEIVEEQELNDTILFDADSIGPLPELTQADCSSLPPPEKVTHIEIIKAVRRVPGASRVVPALTTAWQRGEFRAGEPSITDVYAAFMADEAGGGPRCPECLNEFLSPAALADHVRLRHPALTPEPEYCFVCRKMFLFPSQLADHLSSRHGIQCPDVVCKVCFMELRSAAELRAHGRKHGKDVACPRCPLRFSSEHACQSHYDEHARAHKPFACASCGKRFASEASCVVHGNRHARLSCLTCDLVFDEERSYLSHIKAHAPGAVAHLLARTAALDAEEDRLDTLLQAYLDRQHNLNPDQRPEPADDVAECVASLVHAVSKTTPPPPREAAALQCRLCRAGVATATALVEHHAARHARSRTCPFCRVLSAGASALRRHMQAHVKQAQSEEFCNRTRNRSTLACADCGKSVGSKAALRRHRVAEHDSGAIPRPACDHCFNSATECAEHTNDETQTAFACAVCGKTFVRRAFLARHVRAEHGTAHACQDCTQSFDSKAALHRHAERHKLASARQRFPCPRCPVRCSTRSGLRVHARTHSDERPYACTLCAKAFRRPQALGKHERALHGDAPKHACADCPLAFRERANLVRHFLRVHRDLRRFICGLCAERFTHNQDLRRHLRTKHDTDAPALSGGTKKSVREIYVVPPLGSVDVAFETMAKISRVVERENAKFEGFAERFNVAKESEGRTELESTDLGRTELGRTELGKTELGSTELGKTELGRTELGKTEFGKTELDSTELGSTELGRTELGRTELGRTELRRAEPSTFLALLTLPRLFRCVHCQTLFCLESHFTDHSAQRQDNACPLCAELFCAAPALREHLAQAHGASGVRYRCGICEVDLASKVALTDHLSLEHGVEVTFDVDVDEECTDTGLTGIPVTVHEISRRHDAVVVPATSGAIAAERTPRPAPTAADRLGPTMLVDDQPILGELLVSSYVQPTLNGDQEISSNHQPTLNGDQLLASAVQPTLNGDQLLASAVQPTLNGDQLLASADQQTLNGDQLPASAVLAVSPPGDEDAADAAKKLTCAQCGKRFPEVGRLIRHINTHLGVRAHSCPHCPKRFAEKHNLAVHQRSHTQERPYACADCGARLRYHKEVADHAARHRGHKPHACTQCGRSFLRSGELARHARTHTLVKNFACPVCTKSFRRADELRVHARVHSADAGPTFACAVCAKAFPARDKLRQHAKCHAPRNAFVCHVCGKTFPLELYLKSHLKTHVNRESYLPCPKCTRMFSSEHNLQIHLTKFHAKIAKKGRANSQGKKEDMKTTANQQEEELIERTNAETELEVTEMEIQGELLPAEGSETTGQVIYFHSDGTETETTFIYISSV